MKKILIMTILIMTFYSLVGQVMPSIDQDFCGRTVVIVMDENVGAINRRHDRSFFRNVDIETINDHTILTDEAKTRINTDTFRQLLSLTLSKDCKENVLRVIETLQHVEGIEYVGPNYNNARRQNTKRSKLSTSMELATNSSSKCMEQNHRYT
jgi:hypothetical protein